MKLTWNPLSRTWDFVGDGGGGGSGITQLTGDVTAGPGSGSQTATLASTGVTPGTYTYSTVTVDAKGRVTAASSGTPSGITWPLIVPQGPTIQIRDDGDGDSGIRFTSDGIVDHFANGNLILSIQQNGAIFNRPVTINSNLDVTGNITAANFPQVFNPSQVLISDPTTGLATVWPGTFITPEFGMNFYTAFDLFTNPTYDVLWRFEGAYETTGDVSLNRFMLTYDQHYDRNNAGFNLDGILTNFFFSQNHEGSGSVTTMTMGGMRQQLGSGGNPSSSDELRLIDYSQAVQSGASVTRVRGLSYFLDPSGTISEDFYAYAVNIGNGTIGRNADIFYSNSGADVQDNLRFLVFDSNGSARNFNGVQLNSNHTTSDNYSGVSSNIGNDVGLDVDYFSAFLQNSATVGRNLRVVNFGIEGSVTDSITVFSGYVNGSSGNDMRGYTMSFGSGTSSNATLVDLNFQNHVTSGQLTGIRVGGQGQGSQAALVTINASQITRTDGQRVQAIDLNGGIINTYVEMRTQSSPPNVIDFGNLLGTQLTVDNPITNCDFFNTLISATAFFQEDFSSGILGVGAVGTAFAGQLQVGAGKTADSFTTILAGFSIPDVGPGGGGTLNNATMINMLGAASFGGSITINNLYGLRDHPFFNSLGVANAWGVHFQNDIYNWFKGSLKIGGDVGSTDKASNSLYALEIDAAGNRGARSGNFLRLDPVDSTTRDSIMTSLGGPDGVWFFNSDLGAMQYSSGGGYVTV